MLNLMGVYEAMLTADAGPEAQAAVDVAREKANAAMAAADSPAKSEPGLAAVMAYEGRAMFMVSDGPQ